MKSNKALIVHTERSLGWGGQEIRVLEELRGMQRMGFSAVLFAPCNSQIYKKTEAEGFPVFSVAFSSKIHLVTWLKLFKLIRRLKPMVINTHSSEDSWMAGLVARFLKVSLVIRTRHVSTPISSTFSYRYFPHLILTTSEVIRKNLIQSGLDGRKIVSVPTGIDMGRFKFSYKNRSIIRDRFNVTEKDILVGNICVLRSWKGLDFFIDTVASMPPHYKFIIVGEGPQRQRLQSRAREMQLGNRLIFTGHQEHVEKFFSALDIFFFTSYAYEGIPQSLIQAISIGLPLVICRTPSVIETLQNVDGFISIEYGDLEAACKALEQIRQWILRNKSTMDFNRENIRTKYGLDSMMDTLLGLYRQYGVC